MGRLVRSRQGWRRRVTPADLEGALAGKPLFALFPSRHPTAVACPVCGALAGPLKPSRRRDVTCLRCGTVFNSKRLYIVRLGDVPPPGGEAGVREPRRPGPHAGAGAAALPLPPTGTADD